MVACIFWPLVLSPGRHDATHQGRVEKQGDPIAGLDRSNIHKNGFFAVVLLLGIVERLSRTANLFSIERDWVPTIAHPWGGKEQSESYDLTYLNAVMSRIDLICKLGSPIVMTGFMSITTPTMVLMVLVFFNSLFLPMEFWTARKVYQSFPCLQEPKAAKGSHFDRDRTTTGGPLFAQSNLPLFFWRFWSIVRNSFIGVKVWLSSLYSGLQEYLAAEVWMPSLATSSLHFSILNYSSTFNVFILHAGFSLTFITLGEILSAIFELSSTFAFPWAVGILSGGKNSPYTLPDDSSSSTPMLQLGSDEDDTAPLQDIKNSHLTTSVSLGVSRLGFLSLWQILLCFVSTSGASYTL